MARLLQFLPSTGLALRVCGQRCTQHPLHHHMPDAQCSCCVGHSFLLACLWRSCGLLATHGMQGEVEDVGGWETYAEDWRYFFDCMLAPSARQVCT